MISRSFPLEGEAVFDKLSRENIEQYVVGEIGRAKWRDARIRIVECDGRRAILKDVRGSGPLFRFLFGRHVVAREFRMCKALDGIPGVPRAYRMLDKDGFLAEYIDGAPLSRKKIAAGWKVPDDLYDRCLRLVGELHARGIVHLDLRNKKNFLFTSESGGYRDVYVIDFASAMRIPRWFPFRSRLIALLGSSDRAGVLKMKRRHSPERLTDGERGFLTRFERVRAILLPHMWVLRTIRRARRERIKRARARKERGPRREDSP